MDVLRGIISEDDAYKIPMDLFKGIAAISSDIVLKRINEYLDSPNAMGVVKRIVEEAYSEVTDKKSYYGSEELQELVSELSVLTYADINAGQSLERLERWRNGISDILSSPYAVAYVPPVKADSLNELVQEMQKRAKVKEDRNLLALSERILSHKNLFRDAPFKGYKGTPIKKIVRDKEKYNIILKGLDHLISVKRSGDNPQSWRYM